MPGQTRSYKTGELVVLWITGSPVLYIGEVTQENPLRIKVSEEGPLANLKEGDYIIRDAHTRMLQYDDTHDTCHFLDGCAQRGQKVASGLARLGIDDQKVHELFPPTNK